MTREKILYCIYKQCPGVVEFNTHPWKIDSSVDQQDVFDALYWGLREGLLSPESVHVGNWKSGHPTSYIMCGYPFTLKGDEYFKQMDPSHKRKKLIEDFCKSFITEAGKKSVGVIKILFILGVWIFGIYTPSFWKWIWTLLS